MPRKKIRRFFETGELPGEDNYCPSDVGPLDIKLGGPLSSRKDMRDITEKIKSLGNREAPRESGGAEYLCKVLDSITISNCVDHRDELVHYLGRY